MSLRKSLPWTKSPLIINAPMGGFAGPELASAVSLAGGLGQIGATNDMKDLHTKLSKASSTLTRHSGLLPLGVGLLTFMTKLSDALPVLEEFKPAVVWLFAAMETSDYATWGSAIRKAAPQSQLWIQVGSVSAALEIAKTAKPDVICVQGADAGGHGYEKGAGIISLLPEITDALTTAGYGDIHLVAAGGISTGRSAAAAFALGAQGVVMGTRFLAAEETLVNPIYQRALINASDGGQSTIRSKLFDNLRGPNVWPQAYDGRSIVMESFVDHEAGVEIEEIRRRHAEALKSEEVGFGVDGKGRAAMWAGTGVGFLKKVQPAAEVVEVVRKEVEEVLEGVRARMCVELVF